MILSKSRIKTLFYIITAMILQACYVQKHSESPGEVYESGLKYSNEMITVFEYPEPKPSLDDLSASIIPVDIQKSREMTRWEDNITFGYSRRDVQRKASDIENLGQVVINHY